MRWVLIHYRLFKPFNICFPQKQISVFRRWLANINREDWKSRIPIENRFLLLIAKDDWVYLQMARDAKGWLGNPKDVKND